MFDCKNIASEKADGDTTPAGANTNRVACRDFEKQLADAAERNAGGVLGAIGLVVDEKGTVSPRLILMDH